MSSVVRVCLCCMNTVKKNIFFHNLIDFLFLKRGGLEIHPVIEAATEGVLRKKVKTCNFIKKRSQHRCFPVKFKKFLRTPILKNIFERLLLVLSKVCWCYLLRELFCIKNVLRLTFLSRKSMDLILRNKCRGKKPNCT